MFLTIARKEHKSPTEIANWSLPDVVLMFSSYIDEAKEMEELEKDIPKG
jgi:hypothetical protein